MTSLLCDLGGTNCRFGLAENGDLLPGSLNNFSNDSFADFEAALAEYLNLVSISQVERVVIAVAAPVEGHAIKLTNRDWVVDGRKIESQTGASEVVFLNDFEALGHSIVFPERLNSVSLYQPPSLRENDTRMVMGAGTGFNCATTTFSGEVICAEAGHASFVAENELDFLYQQHFTQKHGRCSIERLVSGSGLLAIYSMLCAHSDVEQKYDNSHDVAKHGLEDQNDLAHKACHEFCRLLGRVAGDLALVTLPYTGIYLTGGVTRALQGLLAYPDGEFIRSFQGKGRMGEQMKEFPIRLIMDDNAALYGCAQRSVKS